jgi:hypothetical protein
MHSHSATLVLVPSTVQCNITRTHTLYNSTTLHIIIIYLYAQVMAECENVGEICDAVRGWQ